MNGRIAQGPALRGSQHWLQLAINHSPELLDLGLRQRLSLDQTQSIEWLSPLERDEYSEYRDQAILSLLGVKLSQRSLDSFWPRRGSVWDGLGKTSRGDLLLVEAKAHLPELASPSCKASEPSRTLIRASLTETRSFFGVTSETDWSQKYYQYTNRLAHLYLLRELNKLPAWLLFVYFVNAEDIGGPSSRQAWEAEIKRVHDYLGITQHCLSSYVIDLFVDVHDITRHDVFGSYCSTAQSK